MHSKRKGKSKSRKPMLDIETMGKGTESLSKDDIEKIIADYAKQGTRPSVIGERLKLDHNVKYIKQATGKRLMALLKGQGMDQPVPPDMLDLMRKAVHMRSHLEKNKQDKHNMLRLSRTESKIFRLSRYYVREGRLPQGWKYDPRKAELIVKGKAR